MPNQIPAHSLAYEFGVMRTFGEADIDTEGLIGDWAQPEPSHIWNDGEAPSLVLITDEPSASVIVEIEGAPFIHEKCPEQTISLYANGFWINSWVLKGNDFRVLRGVVEPEQFFSREDRGFLKLTWHIPSSVSPQLLGEGGDGRELGFCFRSLRLSLVE